MRESGNEVNCATAPLQRRLVSGGFESGRCERLKRRRGQPDDFVVPLLPAGDSHQLNRRGSDTGVVVPLPSIPANRVSIGTCTIVDTSRIVELGELELEPRGE